jgi:hypothetical protein
VEGLEPALIAMLVQIQSGTLGAAGSDLWQSLRSIANRHRKAASLPSVDSNALEADAPAVAEALARAADIDPSLAEDLADWLSKARASVSQRGEINNNVSGPVSGTVIQIGNIRRDRSG